MRPMQLVECYRTEHVPSAEKSRDVLNRDISEYSDYL